MLYQQLLWFLGFTAVSLLLLGDRQGACEDKDIVWPSTGQCSMCSVCVWLRVRWGARRTEFQSSASSCPITGREEGKDAIGMGVGWGGPEASLWLPAKPRGQRTPLMALSKNTPNHQRCHAHSLNSADPGSGHWDDTRVTSRLMQGCEELESENFLTWTSHFSCAVCMALSVQNKILACTFQAGKGTNYESLATRVPRTHVKGGYDRIHL